MAINKRKILESAQRNLQRGALDKALKDYQALLEADPRDTNVRLKIGDLHLRRGETNEAVGAYLKVGAQFMKDGFDAKAVAIYKQIAKIDPARAEVNEPLAELYQRMGLPSEAMGALQAAADTHHRAGRKREALECLRRMASLDPTNTASRLKVAELLRQAKLEAEAIGEYEGVASELERQGDAEGLAAVLEKLLELAPERSALVEQVARLYLRLGQASRAEPFVRRLVEAQPDAPAGLELLAEVHRATGRESELLDLYRRLAEMYRQRGDDDKAREIHQRFLPPTTFVAREDTPPPPPPRANRAVDLGADLDGPLEFDAEDLGAEAIAEEFSAAEISLEDSAAFRRGLLPDPLGSSGAGAQAAGAEVPLAAPSPPPQGAPGPQPPAGAPPEGDPEQLLAEASVYLRYGKHERAIAALEAILTREPRHRAALEKLGETWATQGQGPKAVEVWLRAAELARAAQDAQGHESLRSRIAGLDAKAAQGLPDLRSVATPDSAAASGAALAEAEGRTFPELEFEVDLEGAEPPAGAAEERGGADPPPAPAQQAAERESLPPHVAEALEEARFYREQNLLEEAERIYRRVLAAVPGHAPALLGLGEIAAARGTAREAPGSERIRHRIVSDDAPAARREIGGELPLGTAEDTLDPFADSGDEAPGAPFQAAAPTPGPAREPSAERTPGERRPRPAPLAAEATSPDFGGPGGALGAPAPAAEPPRPAAGRGESFDLAAALCADLEGGDPTAGGVATDEDGFVALFQDFKRAVEQTLGETDGEARYDLGIAYREMGLLEDALQEFGAALGTPARHLDALHMLALCSLDLGRGEDAVTQLTRALGLPDVPAAQQAALRFDLGRAHESLGDREAALEAYRSAGALAPEHPGLAEHIASLEREGSASSRAADPGYESFEDLLVEKEESTDAERPEPDEPLDGAGAGPRGGDASVPGRGAAERGPGRGGETPAVPAPRAVRRKRISFV